MTLVPALSYPILVELLPNDPVLIYDHFEQPWADVILSAVDGVMTIKFDMLFEIEGVFALFQVFKSGDDES